MELKILRLYGLVTTLLLTVFAVSAFKQTRNTKFTEIDVERINIVEPNGHYRMVLSNRPRSIGPIAYGKPFGYPGGGRPGIIFFNDEGTENGKFSSGVHMSFDQYNQDQVVVRQYNDENGTRRTGLTFADRADVPIMEVVAQMDSINQLPDGPAKVEARAKLLGPRNGQVVSRLPN